MVKRGALRRTRARLASRAFTLIELMVVVMLISLIALLAVPSFVEARNDRAAFDYARQYQQILVQGRSRAAGTGSAHLAILTGGTGGRGVIRLYSALDGAAPPSGPNPVASCRGLGQWTTAIPELAGAFPTNALMADNMSRFIDHVDLNLGGINVDMDVRTTLVIGDGPVGSPMLGTPAIAICITPAGVTYVGSGANAAAAVAMMVASAPFNGIAEAQIRRNTGGAGVGLRRRVVIAGGGAPRLRSDTP